VKDRVNPNVVATVNRSAELFRELDVFLRHTAQQNYEVVVVKDSNEELQLSLSRLRSSPKLIQQYIIMLASEAFAGRKPDYEQVNQILELMEGLTGSQVGIDKSNVVFRDRERLIFRRTEDVPEFKFTIVPNHRYQFDRFWFSSEIVEPEGITLNGKDAEYVDADKIASHELILRSWSQGDSFIPLGMKSKKKISDFFVDEKIPIYEKPTIPILETKSGEVIWVCGCRIDDRFRVTSDTRRVMKLQFSTQKKADESQQQKRQD
ncbi:MAG: tRNA lysidine(34) synthetase TilS, partial [Bacteroidota bacterium]